MQVAHCCTRGARVATVATQFKHKAAPRRAPPPPKASAPLPPLAAAVEAAAVYTPQLGEALLGALKARGVQQDLAPRSKVRHR